MSQFDYKGQKEELDVDCATAKVLATLFELQPSTVMLLFNRRTIQPDGDGIFPDLLDGQEYKVIGTKIAPVVAQGNNRSKAVSLVMDEKDVQLIALEVQKDTSALVEKAGVLTSAPKVALLVRAMCLVAGATRDVSLVNDATEDSFKAGVFKHLTTPRSLRGSLFHLKASICSVMSLSTEKMLAIQLALSNIPGCFTTTREVLEEIARGESDGAELAMEIVKRKMQGITTTCMRSATEVKDRMEVVVEEINELSQVLVCTNGYQDGCYENTKRLIEETKDRREAREKEKSQLEVEYKEQKEVAERANREYEKQMSKMGNFGKMFAIAMVDCFTSTISNLSRSIAALPGRAGGAIFESVGKAIPAAQQLDGKANSILSYAAMDALVICIEQALPILEAEQLADGDRKDILDSFKGALDASSKAKDAISRTLKTAVEGAVKKLQNNTPDDHGTVAKALKSELSKYKLAVERQEKEREQHRNADAAVKVAKEKTKQTMMDVHKAALNSAQSKMEQEENRRDALRKELREADRALEEAILNLKRLNLEKIELEDVIEYLKQATSILEDLKAHWDRLAEFFAALTLTIELKFHNSIRDFLEYVYNVEEIGNQTTYTSMQAPKLIRGNMRRISRSMLQSIGVAMQTERIARIYVKISNEYVMPVLSGEQKTFALTKDEAKAALRDVESESLSTKSKVQALLDDAFLECSSGVYEALSEHQRFAIEDKKQRS